MAPILVNAAYPSFVASDQVSVFGDETLRHFWAVLAAIPASILGWPAKIAGDIVSAVSGPFRAVTAWISSAFSAGARNIPDYSRATGVWISVNAQHIAAALLAACHAHPKLIGFTLIGICEPTIVLLGLACVAYVFFLVVALVGSILMVVIGFGAAGVRGGSLAARLQSSMFGSSGGVRAGSSFAHLQSAGARGSSVSVAPSMPGVTLPYIGHPIATAVMWFIRVACGVAGVYILVKF